MHSSRIEKLWVRTENDVQYVAYLCGDIDTWELMTVEEQHHVLELLKGSVDELSLTWHPLEANSAEAHENVFPKMSQRYENEYSMWLAIRTVPVAYPNGMPILSDLGSVELPAMAVQYIGQHNSAPHVTSSQLWVCCDKGQDGWNALPEQYRIQVINKLMTHSVINKVFKFTR
jgi:hypothetical protein